MKNLVITFLLLIFVTIQSQASSRLIDSQYGLSGETRPTREKAILYHTQMEDSTLISSLRSPHQYSQRAAVETIFKQVGEGKQLSPGIKKALKSLSEDSNISYATYAPLKVIMIVSQDTDKEVKAKQLGECFFIDGNYLLKKRAIYYAGKLGYDSLLSQLSTKLIDRNQGNPCLSEDWPYEPIKDYAEVAIELLQMNHQTKEKQATFLLNNHFQKERSMAREEAMEDMGEEMIPIIVGKITTSFSSGNYSEEKNRALVDFVLRPMDISNTNATKIIIPFLKSENPLIRDMAIKTLNGVGTPEAIPYLEKSNPQDKFLKEELPDIIQNIRVRDMKLKEIKNKN
jgi:hypothetical protein